jgi:hypothetical protein
VDLFEKHLQAYQALRQYHFQAILGSCCSTSNLPKTGTVKKKRLLPSPDAYFVVIIKRKQNQNTNM